jgi:hypothetical protein
MAIDLADIFNEWPVDSEDEGENIRCVRGQDGRLKIQVRVRCGIFQWEHEGRPDGRHPHGFASLLDYYRHRMEELVREEGSAESLRFDQREVDEVSEELTDYYQRRVLFFRLGEYERARADAEHNLALMDILREHAEDPEAVVEHEKWRPFVTMDRTRAAAMVGCERGDYLGAIRTLDRGIEEIASFFHQYQRDDLITQSQEITTLEDLKYELRETYSIPLTPEEILQGLQEEQAKAVADEDFERAARLRDEISRLEADRGTDAV